MILRLKDFASRNIGSEDCTAFSKLKERNKEKSALSHDVVYDTWHSINRRRLSLSLSAAGLRTAAQHHRNHRPTLTARSHLPWRPERWLRYFGGPLRPHVCNPKPSRVDLRPCRPLFASLPLRKRYVVNSSCVRIRNPTFMLMSFTDFSFAVGRKPWLSLWRCLCSWIGVGLWLSERLYLGGNRKLAYRRGLVHYPFLLDQAYQSTRKLEPCHFKGRVWWYCHFSKAPRVNIVTRLPISQNLFI